MNTFLGVWERRAQRLSQTALREITEVATQHEMIQTATDLAHSSHDMVLRLVAVVQEFIEVASEHLDNFESE